MSGKRQIIRLGRRDFMKTALAAAGVAASDIATANIASSGRTADIANSGNMPADLIDVNINLSRWPMRRVRFDDTEGLVSMLRSQGVTQAWAGSFDGLFHKDLGGVNARLADECHRAGKGLLVPFGSMNPKHPDWEEELRRCAEVHRMPGIRLHPNYHGYRLDDPDFARLLRLAAERKLLVEIALIMEDRRMMHPQLHIEPTDPMQLISVLKQMPGLRVILLNAVRVLQDQQIIDLAAAGEVYFDIAMLDKFTALADLLTKVPVNRVLFGSYAPLFYFEAALLKLQESPFTAEQLRAIRCENARRLLSGSNLHI